MARILIALFMALFIALPATAHADVIGPDDVPPVCPPSTCPPGTTRWSGGHGSCSPGCGPGAVCASDADCGAAGFHCSPTRFCLEEQFPGNSHITVVTGECAPDGSCGSGECSVERRCTGPVRAPRPARASRGEAEGEASPGRERERDEPADPAVAVAESAPTEDERADDGGCSSSGSTRSRTGPALLMGLVALTLARRRRLRRRR